MTTPDTNTSYNEQNSANQLPTYDVEVSIGAVSLSGAAPPAEAVVWTPEWRPATITDVSPDDWWS